MASLNDRIEGVLLGTAVGDALGAPYEFQPPRGSELAVVMQGGGPWEPGEWTDDTAMALCLATSLVERGGFDPHDQMQRYLRWYRYAFGPKVL